MSSTRLDRHSVTADLRGELIFPDDAGYDAARRVWNQVIDRRPAVIARCAAASDVVTALRLAREHGLPVAVRGGGHSFTGFSTCDGGIVLDLGPMTELVVDPRRRTLTAGPGLRWAEVADAAGEHELAAVGGHVSVVGIAGLTLGGGNGWLSRAHGLACDNLIETDVVTATGELVRASEDEHPDLLWALRGGGGNFGIVVRLVYRLHPMPPLFAGMVMHPIERAGAALRHFRDLNAAATDGTSIAGAIMTAPPEPFVPAQLQGRPVVLFAACHVGPIADGERALAPLREFGPPVVDLFQPTPFPQLQHFFDGSGVSGPYHMRSHLLGEFTDDAIDALVEHAVPLTSPLSATIILPLGGAVARVAPNATAFHHRGASYCLELGAAWLSVAEDPAPHRDWADRIWHAMTPWSVGVEVNHLGDEGAERIRVAYGDNYSRLTELKRVWDPDNVFRLNQNIPPA